MNLFKSPFTPVIFAFFMVLTPWLLSAGNALPAKWGNCTITYDSPFISSACSTSHSTEEPPRRTAAQFGFVSLLILGAFLVASADLGAVLSLLWSEHRLERGLLIRGSSIYIFSVLAAFLVLKLG